MENKEINQQEDWLYSEIVRSLLIRVIIWRQRV